MTKRDYFNAILPLVSHDADLTAFIQHELELLDRKNVNRKPSKKQSENADLMARLYDAMEAEKAYTATEMLSLIPEGADMKIQKMTALVSKMRENLLVSRRVVKGKAYFTKI